MAVVEVMGFQFVKEKITKTTAKMDDLENASKLLSKSLIRICCLKRNNFGIGTNIICL